MKGGENMNLYELNWKPIKDSNGHYFISDTGLMARDEYISYDKLGKKYLRNARIYKPSYNKENGYYGYSYRGKNKSKKNYVHRLVAMHFVENPKPDKYKEVNHIDGDKSNNNADNLEWCNRKKNMEHASKNGLLNTESEKRKIQCAINSRNSAEKRRSEVAEYDENGCLVESSKYIKGNIFRLSHKGHYFRNADLLKEKYGCIPEQIDVERIKHINNKSRKVYVSTNRLGEKETYLKIDDLPVTREKLWFCFNHEIPDENGRMWDIINYDETEFYEKEVEQRKTMVNMLKTNTYKEVAKMFNVSVGNLIKLHRQYSDN
mgnify:CR=1 FL=1